MALGAGLSQLHGYPFEVRYSGGALVRARALSEPAADAYAYLCGLLGGVEPDITVIVADETDWPDDGPSYGMPYFSDQRGDRAGVVLMPAETGEFWVAMTDKLRIDAPHEYAKWVAAYPDGAGGLELQPFIDLLTIHELGHAFEVLGDLRLPAAWLSEIFANLALHTFVATRRPASLGNFEVFSTVGARSEVLTAQARHDGYSTLDEIEAHYPGSEEPIEWWNYVWFQYRWQRLAAALFNADGEDTLIRFWNCFRATDRYAAGFSTAASLAPVLTAEVSETFGRAVRDWR